MRILRWLTRCVNDIEESAEFWKHFFYQIFYTVESILKRNAKIFYMVFMFTMTLGCAPPFVAMALALDKTTLEEVSVKKTIETTLAYHHQLKSIQENRQAAIPDVRRAKAGWLPSVDVTASTGYGHSNDPAGRGRYDDDTADTYNTSSASLVLSQPLWDGLSTYHRVKSAEIQQASLDSRVIDTAMALALDALIAHADLLLKRELLAAAEENVQQHIIILDDQKVLTNDGASTIANVHQIEGRLARTTAQLVDAQASLIEAEENYLRITGTVAPMALQAITLPLPKIMFKNAQECYEIAQKQNPKILAYLSDSKRALQMEKLTRSAYQPTINFELSSNLEHKGDDYTEAMVVMRWNLFNGGADMASERISQAEYREARQGALDITATIKKESYNAWSRHVSSLAQKNLYAEAVKFNKQTREGFMEQFLIGERGLLDVLDAYSEFYNSSTQLATMHTNAYISAYTMFALAGGLLEQFQIEKTSVLVAPLSVQ